MGGHGSADEADELRREIHTTKGEARVVGLTDVGNLLHELETLLEATAGATPTPEVLATIATQLDALEDLLASTAPRVARDDESAPTAGPAGSALIDRTARQASESFLRVDLGSLALLGRGVGELRVGQAELAGFVRDLAGLADLARDTEDAAELAAQLRRIVMRARQLSFDQHTRLDRLDDHVRAVRMVPLASLLEPLPRAARQLAADLGKEVVVRVEGASVEVDRQVLEVIAEPLLHLIRNAIDHGLERPDERRESGKPATGTLTLHARASGSLVIIEVRDDGRGVDVAALGAALIARGEAPIAPEALDDAAILDVLCRHGMSTREHATDVSGRGVGLDVVKRRTESVGGRLRLRTTVGAGTTFTLEVPMSAVLATMVCGTADETRYGFSPHEVESLVPLRGAPIETSGSGLAVRVDGKPVPLFDLVALLEHRDGDPRERAIGLVLAHGERRLALALDSVAGTLPVLQQRLDPFLEGMATVRSFALFATGELAVVLDVGELFRRAGDSSGAPTRHGQGRAVAPARIARVLVVDDSELTRDVVVSLLREMGIEAVEAVDGRAALEQLALFAPDLVMTDLDMPVLDGFELLRQIRARPSSASLPVIVLSSRGSPADIERASSLGADAYLVKNRLEIDQLRRVVSLHLPGRAR